MIQNEFPVGQKITTTARDNSETGIELGIEAELWSEGRFALAKLRFRLSGSYFGELVWSRKGRETNEFPNFSPISFNVKAPSSKRGKR